MKKKLCVLLGIISIIGSIGTTNVFADTKYSTFTYNYEFETGVDYNVELGKPTPTEYVEVKEEDMNIRRNKDTAFIPPSYGIFSGEIDTQQSNPYISLDSRSTARETTSTESAYIVSSETTVSNSSSTVTASNYWDNANQQVNQNIWNNNSLDTEPLYYSDGSIGKLYIPSIDLNQKIYEGETDENMKSGIAHFSFTSAWDGNVVLCSHNSGSYGYFKNLTRLEIGNTIKYTTKYGTRTYTVTSLHTIYDDDFSLLGYLSENTITLVTCQKGVSSQRYVVVATEK